MKQKFFTSSITYIRKFLTGSFMFKHLRALNLYELDFESVASVTSSKPLPRNSTCLGTSIANLAHTDIVRSWSFLHA